MNSGVSVYPLVVRVRGMDSWRLCSQEQAERRGGCGGCAVCIVEYDVLIERQRCTVSLSWSSCYYLISCNIVVQHLGVGIFQHTVFRYR